MNHCEWLDIKQTTLLGSRKCKCQKFCFYSTTNRRCWSATELKRDGDGCKFIHIHIRRHVDIGQRAKKLCVIVWRNLWATTTAVNKPKVCEETNIYRLYGGDNVSTRAILANCHRRIYDGAGAVVTCDLAKWWLRTDCTETELK